MYTKIWMIQLQYTPSQKGVFLFLDDLTVDDPVASDIKCLTMIDFTVLILTLLLKVR